MWAGGVWDGFAHFPTATRSRPRRTSSNPSPTALQWLCASVASRTAREEIQPAARPVTDKLDALTNRQPKREGGPRSASGRLGCLSVNASNLSVTGQIGRAHV